MTKYVLCLIGFLFILTYGNAQDFTIKGRVVDAVSKKPLEATTIYAESIKDSSLIAYTISDLNGFFELEEKSNLKEINLFFSFNGYETLVMKVKAKTLLEIGTIQMEEQAQQLKGVQVVGDRVPITIKKDTVEFNVDSFKTRPDATIEDVLKKLPGVEVDINGKITVNGKDVSQVLVNGQVFFSNDPTVATKSLPKDLISKIQIMDTKTKTQEFTGQEGDGDTKTINLTIREDKNKGVLGRITAGYGTDERYQTNGLLNYFNKNERISLIAASNNINNTGFSFDEIYDMVGNNRGGRMRFNSGGGFQIGGLSFGFGEGITTSSTIGASYANAKKGEYKASGNYFFSYSDSFNDEKTSRENILPDRHFFTDSETNFHGSTNANRGAAAIDLDIDKTIRISIEPSLSVNQTNSQETNNSIATDELGNQLNISNSNRVDEGVQRSYSNRFKIIKKLDTMGRYVTAFFNNRNIEINSNNLLDTSSEIFGDNARVDVLKQRSLIEDKNDSYELGSEYRQPLGKKMFLDFGYEYKNAKLKNNRSVFDFDDEDSVYSNFNTVLSSDFNFRNAQHIPSLGFHSDGEKLRFNIKGEYITNDFFNQDLLRANSFEKKYSNFLVSGTVRYTIKKNVRVRIGLRSRLEIPSINQLQPVTDLSNPLNIITGNPNLSPSINREVHFSFSDYNWKERTGLFVHGGLNFQQDMVSLVTETNSDLFRTTTFTNIDGNYNHYAVVGYSKEIKKDSTFTFKYNIRPFLTFNKSIGFTNGQRLEAKRREIRPRISFIFSYKEFIDIEPEYTVSFNSTKYNLERFNNVDFTEHTASLKTTVYWPKNVVWGNDIRYSYNGNVGPQFDKDALFWNMSLGIDIFDKKATIKVLAYDLLNQNINTRRSTGQDFIQDFQGTVLQRYFMFSATYKFDQFGGAKSKKGRTWRH